MDLMNDRAAVAHALAEHYQALARIPAKSKPAPTISVAEAIDRLHKGEPVVGPLRDYGLRLEREGVRGFDPMRPVLPWSALQTRDIFVSTSSAGGYLVGTDVPGAYDTLRPYSVALSVGAQVLENLSGNTPLPYLSGSATGSWLASETATQAPSDPTFSAATLAPKSYAALTSISRSLRLATAEAEPVIRRHLARLVGSAIDAAALNGSGASGQPSGLLTVSGTQTQSGTTLGQAGVTNMLEQATTNGADDRNTVFVAVPTVREVLQNRERATGSGFVWNAGTVADKPAYATTSMPSGAMICGDFSNVVIGFFGPGLELMVDPYTAFKTGVITVRAIVSVDVGILFPAAFCKSTSIT